MKIIIIIINNIKKANAQDDVDRGYFFFLFVQIKDMSILIEVTKCYWTSKKPRPMG